MGYKKGRKRKAEVNVIEEQGYSGDWTSSAGTGDCPSYTPAQGGRRRKMQESEEQGDSGAGAGHHGTSSVNLGDDPSFTPPAQGFVSALGGSGNTTSKSPTYHTRSSSAKENDTPLTSHLSRLLLAKCNALGTSSRRPVRNVKRDTSQYFPPPGSNLAETAYDKLAIEPPPQAQVLNSQAGRDESARNSSPSQGQIVSPSAHITVEPRTEGSRVHSHENGTSRLSPASSFNYTEIAQLLEDDGCDEVDSAADPALVTVSGYRVKEEFATLLRSILLKYGDIAKNCHLKSTANRSCALERLCAIYQNLQKKQFTGITSMEIDSMLVDVEDLATVVNLEVGWFRERLQDISDSLAKSKQYRAMKEKGGKCEKDLEKAKEKVHLAEMELAAILAEREKNAQALELAKAGMRMFQKSLVADL